MQIPVPVFCLKFLLRMRTNGWTEMLAVANSRVMVLSIYCRPTCATNQRKMGRHYSIQRNFPAVSLKNSIQVSNKVLVASSCVCVCVWLKTGIFVKEPRINQSKGNQFQRENFHSDRVSRSKLPDNSTQWKAPQVCLCHLFKYAVSRAKYVSRAGPICRFAEISAP